VGEDPGGPAVVVRAVEYGEADSVVTFLTRDHGRVGVFARGARSRRKPRFPGALELFTLVDIRFRRRRGGASLANLVTADVVEPFAGLRKDFERVAWASYAAEVAREGTRDGEDAGTVYRLLTGCLAALADRGPRLEDRTAYELALLAALGFAPRLDRCGRCHEQRSPGMSYVIDPAVDGLLCARCGAHGPGRLSPGTLSSLLAVAGTIPPDRPRVAFTRRVADELAGVLPAYFESVLGKALKTKAFLDVAATRAG